MRNVELLPYLSESLKGSFIEIIHRLIVSLGERMRKQMTEKTMVYKCFKIQVVNTTKIQNQSLTHIRVCNMMEGRGEWDVN